METQNLDYSNDETLKKTRIASRITDKTESDILKKIKSNFRNPDDFLKIDNELIINKKIDHEKFKNLNNIKPYQIIGDIDQIFPTAASLNNNLIDSVGLSSKLFSVRTPSKENPNKTYSSPNKSVFNNLKSFTKQIALLKKFKYPLITNSNNKKKEEISDEQVENIFNGKKQLTTGQNFEKKYNSDIINNIDPNCVSEMKDFLFKQEKALKHKEETEKKINNLAKFISFKTQKNERDLLMNKTDGFRLKNQCIQRIQSSNPNRIYNYGVENEWKLKLRKKDEDQSDKKKSNFHLYNYNNLHSENRKISRSKTRKDIRIRTQLNIREDGEELGMIVFDDKKNEVIEQIVKPYSACLKDFRKYANNRTISSKLRDINITCEEMIKVNKLDVMNFLFFIIDLFQNIKLF